MNKDAIYLESACFVLVLAAVYDDRVPSRYIEYVDTGLKLLRKLDKREHVRSIVEALEQMLSRVNTLSAPSVASLHNTPPPLRANQRYVHLPPTATAGLRERTERSLDYSPIATTFGSTSQSPIFATQDTGVLDELWTITDWNLTFPHLNFS